MKSFSPMGPFHAAVALPLALPAQHAIVMMIMMILMILMILMVLMVLHIIVPLHYQGNHTVTALCWIFLLWHKAS